jgi:PhnB protein
MPKRSLNPRDNPRNEAKKAEQLNRAVDVLLARSDGKPPKVDASVEPLARIAGDLRDLPRENFKAALKSELEGRKLMSTVAEPVTGVRRTASPRLSFKDAAKAIEFYTEAFGARQTFRFEAGGGIAHAEMAIGESTIMLTEEWPEGGRFSAETLGNSPISLVLRVDDVDSFAERAVAAGMKVTIPLKDQFYGHRDVTMVDPFGYSWSAATVKEEMSVEEMHRRMHGMTERPEGGQTSPTHQAQKGVDPIPRGFHTVTPYLVAADGDAMIAFAKNAFGAEETFRTIGGAGGIHAEVRIGDSMLMMGGGIPGKPFDSKPNTTALHVYVKDTDAVYKKALQAGATSLSEPKDQDYGERGAGVKDPFGNYWYIATHQGESYIPKGLHNVNVYMHPWRAEPVIGFLNRAFGARELGKYASPDGIVHHAEIQVGTSVVEMGEAHAPYDPMQSMFYVYVPDCDAVYQRALAAGAKTIHQPADQPYGDRVGAVTDAFGNQWWIATHVKDMAH